MENVNKGMPIIGRALQRVLRQYSGPELMDFSGTKETKKGIYWNCGKYGYYIQDC